MMDTQLHDGVYTFVGNAKHLIAVNFLGVMPILVSVIIPLYIFFFVWTIIRDAATGKHDATRRRNNEAINRLISTPGGMALYEKGRKEGKWTSLDDFLNPKPQEFTSPTKEGDKWGHA